MDSTSHTYVQMNGETRKAMADQITTASKRLQARIGVPSPKDMAGVDGMLRLQLGLA